MKIFYSVEDVSPGELLPILARGYPRKVQQEFYGLEYTDDLNFIAKEAANDWHYNHDGWEHSSWPVEFKLCDEKEKVLGTFSVDRDVEPVFSARKIK